MSSEDTTIRALYEITRTHGEGLCEVLATVPFVELEEKFRLWCGIARKRNLDGRFSYRRLAA